MTISFPGLAPGEKDLRRIVDVVRGVLAGKLNAVTSVTLRNGHTTTTLTDSRIGGGTFIGLSPTTATAAAATTAVYVSAKDKGTATLTHDNTADTDRTFDVVLVG
jgi:hypothetical protein